MEASLFPVAKSQFYGTSGLFLGKPLAGGKLYTYVAGGYVTPKTTYTDSTAAIPNTNPVILDSNGMANIWIAGYYNIALYDANNVLQYTEANVSSFAAGNIVTAQWFLQSLTSLTYISGTVFTCSGDLTSTLVKGGRIQAVVTAGTITGTIVSSVYTSLTTVTVLWDNGESLDSGLSAISTGVLTIQHNSLPINPIHVKSGNYTFNIDDTMKFFVFDSGAAVSGSLPAANTVPSGAWFEVKNIGAGALTIVGTVDNVASPVIPQYSGLLIWSNGTSWQGAFFGKTVAFGTAAYTDSTAYDPSGSSSGVISDEAYNSDWNGVTAIAPSKNAVYDIIESRAPVPAALAAGEMTVAGTSGTTYAASYTKIGEIQMNRGGTIRVVLTVCGGITPFGDAYSGYAKVYKNGSPLGAELVSINNQYQTLIADFSGIIAGDLIQLYAFSDPGGVIDTIAATLTIKVCDPIYATVTL